jgi:hypothetical protein
MNNQPSSTKPKGIVRQIFTLPSSSKVKQPESSAKSFDFEPLRHGAANNWDEWKQQLKHRAGIHFQLADVIQEEDYPNYDPPEVDANLFQTDILYKTRMIEALKTSLNNQSALADKKLALYSYIMLHISDESEQKLKEQPTWNAISLAKDPLLLYQLLKVTHFGVVTGNLQVDRVKAQKDFVNIRQHEKESLIEYKKKFEHKVNTLSSLQLPIPNDQEQAITFIKGLDSAQYAALKDEYESGSVIGSVTYPANVTEAYNIVVNYTSGQKAKKGRGKKPRNVAYSTQTKIVEVEEEEEVEVEQVVNATINNAGKKGKKRGYHEMQEKDKSCMFCPDCKDHWTKYCPKIQHLLPQPNVVAATTSTQVEPGSSRTTRSQSKKAQNKKGKKGFSNAAIVNLSTYENKDLGKYDVALDTAATVMLIKEKDLLSNLRKVSQPIEIKAVNGECLTTDVVGDLFQFGPAYYHPKAQINLVPLGELENKFKIHYNPKKDFTVKLGSNNIRFKKRLFDEKGNGLYVWDASDIIQKNIVNVATVEENKLAYSKREYRDAELAKKLIRNLGFPSARQVIDMIQSGSILECPITVHDVVRANEIFGPDIPSLKGKTSHKKTPAFKTEFINKPTTEQQVLHADVMFIDNMPYLISISTPMNLLLSTSLDSRSKEDIAEAIISQVNTYKSEGFIVKMIECDGEGGIIVAKDLLAENGVTLNKCAAGQHVPTAERSIRTIKERIRSILASLPYNVPKSFMKYLVNFVIMKINSLPKTTLLSKTSPREVFTGRKINYKKDLRFGFGDYVQIETPSAINKNSVRIPRTEGAIAVCPTGNLQGSVIFYLLSTGKFVTRDHFKVLPMPTHVIDRLNQLAGEVSRSNYDVDVPSDEEDESDNDDDNLAEFQPKLHATEGIDEEGPNIQPDEDIEGNEIDQTTPTVVVAEPPQETRRYPLRERRPVEKLTLAARKHQSVESTLKRHEAETIKAVHDELSQMVSKDVFTPIDPEVKVDDWIYSFMFMKEKYDSTGKFDKIKARLVAGGNNQFNSVMSTSSPTVSLQGIFMTSAIAAKEKREIASCDVPGAYLNAIMIGDVHMKLDRFNSAVLCRIKPEYDKYLRTDGTMIVKLNKALYGCVESAKLWYDTFANAIRSYGFIPNELEPCIFNKNVDDKQVTICLYVDDLMITSETKELLNDTIKFLERQFKGLTATVGKVHSYLGMTFNFETPGEVKITTERYINEIMTENNVHGSSTVPASNDLFDIVESPELDEKRKATFHSVVAKLLYLAKRTRPDILTAISFLTTRVTKSNEKDWSKLQKVLRYLNGTRELGIILSPSKGEMKLQAYVDASYGTHHDGKSHSGLYIALGKGPVFVRSSKQKIVSKSSTEAELVALSDACSQVIWSRDFLINQGYDVSSVTVFEDNKSTLALVHNGKSTSERTKHINIRYHFIKDKIENGEIDLQYMSTDQMIADVLTKPLPGKKFIDLRNKLLNWHY